MGETSSSEGSSGAPTFFTYFTTNDYAPAGNWTGGYNAIKSGWCQWSSTLAPGMALTGSSVYGGTQVNIQPTIQYFDEAGSPNGIAGWWVSVSSSWVGYYPKCRDCNATTCTTSKPFLFATSGMRNKASAAWWYGEVDDFIAPSPTVTDMGSGKSAFDGPNQAAYIRNVQLINKSNYPTWEYQQDTTGSLTSAATDNYCYALDGVHNGSPGVWSNWMYEAPPVPWTV